MADGKAKLSKAEELRRRAQSRKAKRVNEYELFGVEDGFDPPLVITRPTVEQMDEASIAQSRGMVFESVRRAWGEKNYERIVEEFGDDLDMEMIQELVEDVNEAFWGKGVNDVPGGSTAS